MRHDIDPLYAIFEQHLFNALVEEEATEAFLERVVYDYVERMKSMGTVIPVQFEESLKADLKEEVLEMLRKKTYGHFDLNTFRKARGITGSATASPKEKARRSGRAS